MRKTALTTAILLSCIFLYAQPASRTPRLPGGTESPADRAGTPTDTPDGIGTITYGRKTFLNHRHKRPYPADTVTVVIAGDIMLHSAQIENCHDRYAASDPGADPDESSAYDFSPCLAGIRDILESADLCIANMEFTLAGPPYSGYPAFCAPDSFAGYVADCGVDIFLTANNHILDKGDRGAARTLEVYWRMRERGILDTGCFADSLSLEAGYPLIVDVKGLKIALVNFTYGTNVPPGNGFPKVCRMDREEIASAMEKARETADIIIALPHWGIEYDLKHSDEQYRMAEFLVRRGADAIVGSHPHVVQDTGRMMALDGDHVPVIYSLGNLISNMSAANTQTGLVVTLPIVRHPDGRATVCPPEYTFTWCSLPGKLTDAHVTVPIEKYEDRRDEWNDPSDYDRMITTFNRILKTSGAVNR